MTKGETRTAVQPKEVENHASATPQNLSLTSCDLDLWPSASETELS